VCRELAMRMWEDNKDVYNQQAMRVCAYAIYAVYVTVVGDHFP